MWANEHNWYSPSACRCTFCILPLASLFPWEKVSRRLLNPGLHRFLNLIIRGVKLWLRGASVCGLKMWKCDSGMASLQGRAWRSSRWCCAVLHCCGRCLEKHTDQIELRRLLSFSRFKTFYPFTNVSFKPCCCHFRPEPTFYGIFRLVSKKFHYVEQWYNPASERPCLFHHWHQLN